MKLSKRHHFIPEFLLRNFTNKNGKFYIYLVHEDRFKYGGREFSPKQQFFEHNANQTFIGKRESLFIEEQYSNLDSKVGAIIHSFKCDPYYKPTEYEWSTIQYFVDSMFWRNPVNEIRLKEKIKFAKSLSELGLVSAGQEDESKKWSIEEINNDEGVYKYIKLMLPMIKELETDKEMMLFMLNYNYKIFGNRIPNLIGDNPVIYRNPESETLNKEEYVFPFAPNLLLIRTNVNDLAIWREVRIMVDMLQIAQAKEYVAVTNQQYPGLLRQFYEKTFTSIDHLRRSIFEHIFEKSKIKWEEGILHA